MTLEQRLMEIYAHLTAAYIQIPPSGDFTVVNHVMKARDQALLALRDIRNKPVEALVETLSEEPAHV